MITSIFSKVLGLILVSSILCVSNSAATEFFNSEFTAKYTLESDGTLIGRTNWSLSYDGNLSVVFLSESKVAGIAAFFTNDEIIERSEWLNNGDGFLPSRYLYQRTGGKKNKEVYVDFDWVNGTVKNTVKGKTWTMEVPKKTFDKLGYILVVMSDLQQGKTDLTYHIADGGKLKTYKMEVVGTELVPTKIGVIDTYLVRRLRKDRKRETLFWLAPELQYLPVKIEHRDKNGGTIELLIEAVN